MIIYIILLYDRVQGLKHLNARNVPITLLHYTNIFYIQVLRHSGLVPSQNSYNGRNMRSAHTRPTSRETGHTLPNQQTKVRLG